MRETKLFHISDVITITDGRFVSVNGIDGIYDILNWMTGENLYTHQLPRAGRQAQPYLEKQHPELAAVRVPNWEEYTEAKLKDWLTAVGAELGYSEVEVEPIPEDERKPIEPMAELQSMLERMSDVG